MRVPQNVQIPEKVPWVNEIGKHCSRPEVLTVGRDYIFSGLC